MIEETRDVATLDLNSDNDNKIISAKIEITLYPDINYNRLADFILDNCADIEVSISHLIWWIIEITTGLISIVLKNLILNRFLKNCIDLYLMVYNLPAYTIILNK